MGMNYLAVLIGCAICFVGTYMKKICMPVVGCIWGGGASFSFLMFTYGVGFYIFDDPSAWIVILICIACLGLTMAVYKKAGLIICAGAAVFASVSFVLEVDSFYTGSDGHLLLSILLGISTSIVFWKFDKYSVMALTSFTGAVLIGTAGWGILNDYTLGGMLRHVVWNGTSDMPSLGLVIVVITVLGFIVQYLHLQNIQQKQMIATNRATVPVQNKNQQTTVVKKVEWKCSCGRMSTGNFCMACGREAPKKSQLESSMWLCSCGCKNNGNFCANCGQKRK